MILPAFASGLRACGWSTVWVLSSKRVAGKNRMRSLLYPPHRTPRRPPQAGAALFLEVGNWLRRFSNVDKSDHLFAGRGDHWGTRLIDLEKCLPLHFGSGA